MSTVSSLISAVEYRLGGRSIDSSTTPSLEQCLSQLNSDIGWILGKCAEQNSDLGRTTGSITTVAGTDSYSNFATDMYAPSNYGWVLDTYSRNKIVLTTEESILDYNPHSSGRAEPTHFYVDSSNNVVFLPTPDDAYSMRIPYWQVQTTLTAKSDTMPFSGLFDSVLVESLTLRLTDNYKGEEESGYEYKWFQSLDKRVSRMIEIRKNLASSVGV